MAGLTFGAKARTFFLRIVIIVAPVYVVAVLIWKFAFHMSWAYSLVGVPLGLLIGGIVVCFLLAYLDRLNRQRNGKKRNWLSPEDRR